MFKKNKYRLMVLGKLKPYGKGIKRYLILNLFLSIVAVALSFATPQLYKIFIDRIILQGEIKILTLIIVGYLSIQTITIIISYVKNYGNNRIVNRVNFRIKLKIWRNLFKQDFTKYEQQPVGDTKMRFEDDVNAVATFASYQTLEYIISHITLIVSIFFLFSIEWKLAVFSLLTLPITFIMDHLLSKKEEVLNNEQRNNDQKMASWLHTSIQGWREIKALNLYQNQQIQFVRHIRKYALYYAKWIHYWTLRVLILPNLRDEFFMKFGLYFLGGLLIIYDDFRISDLLIFAMYYGILSTAINAISTTDAELQTQMPYLNRVMEELDKLVLKAEKNGVLPDSSNTIIFSHVTFRYPDSEGNILQDLNMQINKGERVAITGKSGIGKSTVLKLMTGLLTPNNGNVIFAGVNLVDANIAEVHKRIGFVMQENMLFNTTIADNLRYGKSNATFEELNEACKQAYIHDFISRLPDGLHTVIGERGIKLSGGQRQRLILARLFLREVDIFIFDEATSALDQYSESIVHDTINSIPNDKTIIVVAHRSSSISLCDRRIMLDQLS